MSHQVIKLTPKSIEVHVQIAQQRGLGLVSAFLMLVSDNNHSDRNDVKRRLAECNIHLAYLFLNLATDRYVAIKTHIPSDDYADVEAVTTYCKGRDMIWDIAALAEMLSSDDLLSEGQRTGVVARAAVVALHLIALANSHGFDLREITDRYMLSESLSQLHMQSIGLNY